jgi:hypothetical protein
MIVSIIATIVAAILLYMCVAFSPFILPNYRLCKYNGNIEIVGRINVLRQVRYTTVDFGTPEVPLTDQRVDIYISLPNGTPINIAHCDASAVEEFVSQRWAAIPGQRWPRGTECLEVGEWTFYTLRSDVLGIRGGPFEEYSKAKISADSHDWRKFPLTQDDVTDLFGSNGVIIDHTRF